MPKTILYIHHGKGLGGAPLSLLYLIQGLDKTRFKPIVLFLYDSEVIDLYKKHDIQTIGPLNIMDFSHTKIWWFRWYHAHFIARACRDTLKTIFFIAPKILKQIKPDIVHLNTSSLIGWAIAAQRQKIPVIWHVREPLADGYFGIRKSLTRWGVARYANKIIPISNSDARPWHKNQKTQVIYNPVDPQRFNAAQFDKISQSENSNQPAPTILFLGGLSAEKGTLVILQAMKLLLKKMPNARLHLAGTCELSQTSQYSPKYFFPAARYKRLVADLLQELGPAVTLLGSIHNVPAAMAQSNVIVFPATVGHFARPIIEAGFMKKPVVASKLAPLDELVVHEKTGFLVDTHDHAAWAKTLFLLLSNRELQESMGLEAYNFCSQRFGLELYATTIQNVYEQLTSQ